MLRNVEPIIHGPSIEIESEFIGEMVRDDFPGLHSTNQQKTLVYLDNAATTQKPQSVISAVNEFYANGVANVHRGIYGLSERRTHQYNEAREKVKKFINAEKTEEVVFVRGTTEAINLVAQSYGRKFIRKGDEIIISAMEHHSNIVPWQILCEQTGAVLKVVPMNDQGELLISEYKKLLSPQTKFIALSYVSNVLGTINPIKRMIQIAHQQGVPVLIDGAQAVSHLPIDVQDLDCDFFAFSGHKMYGPTGIGIL